MNSDLIVNIQVIDLNKLNAGVAIKYKRKDEYYKNAIVTNATWQGLYVVESDYDDGFTTEYISLGDILDNEIQIEILK